MKEWKVRQEMYHRLTTGQERGDDLAKEKIEENFSPLEVVKKAIEYYHKDSEVLYYPAKSYAIAILYAKLLEREFGEDLYVALSDPDLLFQNDPYFKTYPESSKIYDEVLESFPEDILLTPEKFSRNAHKSFQYFYKEFLLEGEVAKNVLP